jgi:antirestriction protein ArdC
MQHEKARDLTQQALENLSAALERGESDTLKAVLAAAARFHRYSFRNIMLIATQRPDATNVAGFNTWRKLGRFVKRGEKGIVIVAPVPFRRRDAEQSEATDDESGIRFKAAYVFDVTQTNGDPLPEHAEVAGDPAEYTERLKGLIASRSIVLDYADDLGGADGTSSGGHITIRRGLSPAEEFSVLAHELAHETLHHGASSEPRPPRTVRETEAEAVAFVVASAIGLSTNTAASDYIQLYQGTPDTLAASLACIQGAASDIIAALTEAPEAPPA